MMDSRIVAGNFSRNPAVYDRNAEMQKLSAADLSSFLISTSKKGNYSKILELGCGTGFLTEKILELFPDAGFIITDISGEMLDYCRNKMEKKLHHRNATIKYSTCDIAGKLPAGKFDLIISNLAFQWLQSPENEIMRLRDILEPEGILCFSTIIEPTFKNLRKTFSDLGINYPGPDFHRAEKVKKACQSFRNKKFSESKYIENYPSMVSLLKHLNSIGAGNATGKRLPYSELKKYIVHHKEESGKATEVSVEYHTISAVCG